MSNIEVVVSTTYNHRTVTALCKGNQFLIPVPTQQFNFAEIVSTITFADHHEQCLELLAGTKTIVPIKDFYRLQEICSRYFDVKLDVNYDVIVAKILTDNSPIEYLNILKFPEVVGLIKRALHGVNTASMLNKIIRKFSKFIRDGARNQLEKESLLKLLEFYQKEELEEEPKQVKKNESPPIQSKASESSLKSSDKEKQKKHRKSKNDTEDISVYHPENDQKGEFVVVQDSKKNQQAAKKENEAEQTGKKVQQRNKPNQKRYYKHQTKELGRSNDSKGDNRRESSSKKMQKSKENKDVRILLGINGDTTEGWRARNRPQRVPQPPKEVLITEQFLIKSALKATDASSKAQSKELKKLYSFPKDGKDFKFQKNKNYNLHVNNHLWICISKDQVVIKKDGKGYVRKGNVEIDQDKNGIMAEGLTITMDGICNLEDGGHPFGDPKFEEFLINGKQFFKLINLEIYAE